MITWRSSLVAAALALAGCAEGTGPAFLSGELVGPPPEPLRAAALDRGAVQLVAPAGYCVDPVTLRARFALIARCDTLGGEGAGLDLPLALVTVSLTPGDEVTDPAIGTAELLDRRVGDNITLLRVRGEPMEPGFSQVHWRGSGQVAGYAVGLAAYGPEGGRVEGDAGARLLTGVMASLQDAALPETAPKTEAEPAQDVPPSPRRAENGVLTRLAGLFD